jgi:hypothetical protein
MFSVMCNLVSWFIWEINDIAVLSPHLLSGFC